MCVAYVIVTSTERFLHVGNVVLSSLRSGSEADRAQAPPTPSWRAPATCPHPPCAMFRSATQLLTKHIWFGFWAGKQSKRQRCQGLAQEAGDQSPRLVSDGRLARLLTWQLGLKKKHSSTAACPSKLLCLEQFARPDSDRLPPLGRWNGRAFSFVYL